MELTTALVFGCMALGLWLLYVALRSGPETAGEKQPTHIGITPATFEGLSGEDVLQQKPVQKSHGDTDEQESLDALILRLESTDPQQAELMRQFRHFVDAVAEQYKLPPLPVAVTQALRLIRQELLDIREICRVLSADAALAGRILSLARSPIFGLRRLPNTLQQAVKVLGLQSLRRILVTAGAQTLYGGQSEAAAAAWRHSLATALACQFLAKRGGSIESDQAFLAGLLHDVGALVMLHGNRAQFDKMWQRSRVKRGFSLDWEREFFPCDHAWIGASVLYRWHLDTAVVMAALSHHEGLGAQSPDALVALVKMGDWIANRIGAGFLLEPITPTSEMLAYYGCETEEKVQEISNHVLQIFDEERAALEGKAAA